MNLTRGYETTLALALCRDDRLVARRASLAKCLAEGAKVEYEVEQGPKGSAGAERKRRFGGVRLWLSRRAA